MELKDWLQQTTAADLMNSDVAAFHTDQTLASAAEVFLKQRISGAPVLDSAGVCVGILSVPDLLVAEGRVAAEAVHVAEENIFNSTLVLPTHVYEERLLEYQDKLAPAAEQPVSRFMTTSLVSVARGTSLGDLVKRMADAHIHRVVVLEPNGHLAGIVSSTDVLSALAQAAG